MPQAVGIAPHATPSTPSAASGSQSGSTSNPTRQCDERRRELLDGAVPGRPGREVVGLPITVSDERCCGDTPILGRDISTVPGASCDPDPDRVSRGLAPAARVIEENEACGGQGDPDAGHHFAPKHKTGDSSKPKTKSDCVGDPDAGHSITPGLGTDDRQMGDGTASGGRRGPDGHRPTSTGEPNRRKLSGVTTSEWRSGTAGHCRAPEDEPHGHDPSLKSGDRAEDIRHQLGHTFEDPTWIKVGRSSHDCWDPGGTNLPGCPPSA